MKHLHSDKSGFTLIEIMVVVVILGILAAIVVPRFLDRPDQAKVTKAQIDMKGLEQSLGLFKLDNGFFPSTQQGLEALVEKPTQGRIPEKFQEGGYLRKVPLDPWNNPYLYISPGTHNKDFDLISRGADGQQGGEGFDADINNWELD